MSSNSRRKDVYQRIEDTKEKIKLTEERLAQFKDDLRILNLEKDDLEMKKLFAQMKTQGLDINVALQMLQNN